MLIQIKSIRQIHKKPKRLQHVLKIIRQVHIKSSNNVIQNNQNITKTPKLYTRKYLLFSW